MTIDEAVAVLSNATQHRITRDRLEAAASQLTDVLDGIDLILRAELIRVETERPGDDYAWLVDPDSGAAAYVLIPAEGDEVLL